MSGVAGMRWHRGEPDPDAEWAVTLRTAHARATAYRQRGRPVPAWLAPLEREYGRWRKRVQRGLAPEVRRAA